MRGWAWIAVAPDGRTAATGRLERGEVHIDVLDLPSGRQIASWRASRQGLSWLLFSPDGKSLYGSLLEIEGVGFNQHGFGQIWNAATGRPTTPLMAGTTVPPFTPLRAIVFWQRLNTGSPSMTLPPRVKEARGFLSEVPLLCIRTVTRCLPTLLRIVPLWQVSADAEPLGDGGTGKRATPTGSVANRRWRGLNAFRSG